MRLAVKQAESYAHPFGGVKRFFNLKVNIMAHKKKNVRKKECPICQREFSWTKKLDKNWESMVYCSDQCRRVKKYEGLDHKKEDR